MMKRRGFLKFLSALPALALLPGGSANRAPQPRMTAAKAREAREFFNAHDMPATAQWHAQAQEFFSTPHPCALSDSVWDQVAVQHPADKLAAEVSRAFSRQFQHDAYEAMFSGR